MALPTLTVFYGGPEGFAPRAAWTLDTMAAPLGRRVALERDPARAGRCALAYAPMPVPGVPTVPCSSEAMRLFAADAPLPPGSFRRFDGPRGPLVGAFSAGEDDEAGRGVARWGAATPQGDDGGGADADRHGDAFAVPFDLVASAFVLVACWDEHTRAERDRFGRLPYSASVFATNPALRIETPAVDAYVDALRAVLGPRLAALGEAEPPPTGWMWCDGQGQTGAPGFAIALTHDLDNLWRWTPRGFAASGRRAVRAALRADWPAVCREAGDVREWLTVHLPQGSDPHWTFTTIMTGEDARGADSTFFVIASHSHPYDGSRPRTYRRRIPAALELLRAGGREVGLHGNDRDRSAVEFLDADRRDLERRAGAPVDGMRYHYLRCLYHETLPLVDAAGFTYDSSLAFAEHEGFRCGVSFPFHPYHLAKERPLRLLEVPLALMDTGLQGPQYRALPAADAEPVALEILERVRAAGGGSAVLWHNVRFDRRTARGYDDLYWRLVERVRAQGGLAVSAGELARRWRKAFDDDPAADGDRGRGSRTIAAQPTSAAAAAAASAARGRTPPRPVDHAGPVRMARVLHLSVVHRPDDPRIYERECRSLAEAGYEVSYLVPGGDGTRDAHGVRCASLPVRGRATRWLSAPQVVREIRALRPDVLHVHDPELLTLFPAVRAMVPRLVYDMHEYVPEQVAAKHYIPGPARPWAGRGAVVVTDDQLAALGPRPALRAVLPNYPRLARFREATPHPDLAADPRLKLIYVGSLSRNRGCGVMLDVMERLAPHEALLYLGGTFASPDMEEETRRRLASGLADRVRLLGRVPPAELPSYLAAADVVWVPSVPSTQYTHPTVPTKLFEGMAVGLAALVSDLPGRGELVRAERCGLAVPFGPEGHLAGVRRLLADRDALGEMGARGRQAVTREYCWERLEGELTAFYAALCRGLTRTDRD